MNVDLIFASDIVASKPMQSLHYKVRRERGVQGPTVDRPR